MSGLPESEYRWAASLRSCAPRRRELARGCRPRSCTWCRRCGGRICSRRPVAETLDWAAALVELDAVALDPAMVSDTLGVLLKYQDDIARIQGSKVQELIDEMRAELKAAE